MRKAIVLGMLLGFAWFSDVYGYLISPVNCLANYGSELVKSTTEFGLCVYKNVTFQKDNAV